MPEQSHQKTILYKRWNVYYTQKEGWAPKDMTVSATFEEGKEPSRETMTALAMNAMNEAQAHCDALNSRPLDSDKFTTENTKP